MKFDLVLLECFFNVDSWKTIGDSKLRARYNRTVIGPLWEILGSLLLLILISLVWSKLWNKSFKEFFTYVFIGFTVWRVILSSVTDATVLFNSTYRGVIKNIKIDPFLLAISSSYRNFITLILNFPIMIIATYFSGQLSIYFIYTTLIFTILFFISSSCATYILAIITTRYRDLEHSLNVILGMLFFFTPIIWQADQIGQGAKFLLIESNFLYHFINFFRSGFVNGKIEYFSMVMMIIVTILLFFVATFLHNKYKKKIIFWIDY